MDIDEVQRTKETKEKTLSVRAEVVEEKMGGDVPSCRLELVGTVRARFLVGSTTVGLQLVPPTLGFLLFLSLSILKKKFSGFALSKVPKSGLFRRETLYG